MHEVTSNVSKPTKTQRWATRRVGGASGVRKRLSIMDRLPRRPTLRGEKRKSGTPEQSNDNEQNEKEEDGEGARKVYFNQPIPESQRDEDGHPLANYPRNKIRTAKYTPLSFVPKNLWIQFHNIANIYFVFVIILNVRPFLHRALARRLITISSSLYSVPTTPVSTPFL